MHDGTRICARTRALWQQLGEESVILDAEAGTYYGLNTVGTRVWDLIQSPRTLGEVRDALVAEFDVERAVCERDLRALVAELVRRGLAGLQPAA